MFEIFRHKSVNGHFWGYNDNKIKLRIFFLALLVQWPISLPPFAGLINFLQNFLKGFPVGGKVLPQMGHTVLVPAEILGGVESSWKSSIFPVFTLEHHEKSCKNFVLLCCMSTLQFCYTSMT